MRTLRPALLLILVASCGEEEPVTPDPVQIIDTFEALHRPIYEVYGLPLDRDAIWERVDGSFVGEARTQQYVEHWTTRNRMARESTSIDVRRVEYDAVEAIDVGPGWARVDAAWSVGGIVTHQAHKHPRVNRYRATYELVWEEQAADWRIAATAMRDLERVRSPNRDGGVFDALDAAPEEGGGYMDPLDLLDAGLGEDTGTPGETDATPDGGTP